MLLSETWRWSGDDAARARARAGRAPGARLARRARPTSTATASSSSTAAASAGSRCSAGRTRGTRCSSPTARSRDRRSPSARCRATRTPRASRVRRARARGLGRPRARRRGSSATPPRCATRFDEAFWVERGDAAFYALALDHDKRPVDALSSNAGAPAVDRASPSRSASTRCAELLRSRRMFSGCGIRTLAAGNLRLQPDRVPHGHRLAARLEPDRVRPRAAAGYRDDAVRIMRGLARRRASTSAGACPRSSPATTASAPGFPVEYPIACSPQAWAAGAPLLCLRAVIGMEPDRAGRTITHRSRRTTSTGSRRTSAGAGCARSASASMSTSRRRGQPSSSSKTGRPACCWPTSRRHRTASRRRRPGSAKRDLIAACLARLEPAEAPIGLAFLAGEPRQRKTGIGYRGLGDPPPPANEPTLTLVEVDARLAQLEALSGPGSSGERKRLAARALRPCDGRRAAIPARPPDGRPAPGRARRRADRRGCEGRGGPASSRTPRAPAGRRPPDGRRGGARRWHARARGVPHRGRAAARADARRQRTGCRDGDRAPRDGRRGVEARRCARAGARARRRRRDLQQEPRRRDRAHARDRRDRTRAAGARRRARRRGDRPRRGSATAPVSGHGQSRGPSHGGERAVSAPVRLPPPRRRGPHRPRRARSDRRPRCPRFPPRCACRASWCTTPRAPRPRSRRRSPRATRVSC